MGLSISKELVKLMGGKIKVKSKLGVGSIFSFYITYKPVEKTEQKSSLGTNNSEKPLFSNDTTVLIADDIKENRELLKQLLEQYNIKTEEAKDGLEVLEKLKKHKVDMILLDILMPNLNGYDTMLKISENKKYQNIPIVVVSANVFKEDRQKAVSLGAKEFLSKPVDEDALVKILKQYLTITPSFENQKISKDEVIVVSDEFKKELEECIKKLDGNGILKLLEIYDIPIILKNDIEKKVKSFRFDDINFNNKTL